MAKVFIGNIKGPQGDDFTYEDFTEEQLAALTGPPGDDGDDGVTFTPSVDAEGNLSWTNDGGKENPAATNIRGPAGEADYTKVAEYEASAKEAAEAAASSAESAATSANDAAKSANAASASEETAGISAGEAKGHESSARTYALDAIDKAEEARIHSNNASKSAEEAATSAEEALESMRFAAESAGEALLGATQAADSANAAEESAVRAESAVGKGIFYIEGTGTTAGTWLGSHEDITEYYPGLVIAYKLNVAGASTTTLNINGLGAVPVVRNVSTAVSTAYAVGCVLILTYTEDSGTARWKIAEYDSDAKVSQRSITADNAYPLLFKYAAGNTSTSNTSAYAGFNNAMYVNPATGELVTPNITALGERVTALESAGGYEVPDYWADAVDAVVEQITAYQDAAGSQLVCFGLCSDMHVHWPYPTDNNYCLNIGHLAAAVMDRCGIPLFVNCGDVLTNTVYDTEAEVIRAFNWAWDNYLDLIGAERLLLVAGNHDGAYKTIGTKDYAKNMKPALLNRYLYKDQQMDFRRVWGASGKYFYIDNKPQLTRIIMLNSHDQEWGEDADGKALCSTMSGGYRQEQMDWLIEALDVPEGWSIVIASHVPPTAKLPTSYSGTRGYDIVRGIVSAYADRSTYSGSYTYDSTKGEGAWANMDVSVDFAEAKGAVVGWFCGHCHRDAIITGDLPFPIVTITCAGNFSYDDTEPDRTFGSATETALDFVCIDKSAKKLHAVRLGIGVDEDGIRTVTYASDFTITNYLTNVTSDNAETKANEGDSYVANLTAPDGYALETVTVTMGGADITSTAYSDGVVSIESITGDVVITAEAVSTDPFALTASNWTVNGSSGNITVDASGVTIEKASANGRFVTCKNVFTRKAGTYSFSFKTNGQSANNYGMAGVRCFDASGNILTDVAVYTPNHSKSYNTAFSAFLMSTGYASFTFTLSEAVATFQFVFAPGTQIAVDSTATFSDFNLVEPS